MNSTLQRPDLDELHSFALPKRDVGLIAAAVAFFHANHAAARITPEETEQARELFEFFKSIYNSKGAR